MFISYSSSGLSNAERQAQIYGILDNAYNWKPNCFSYFDFILSVMGSCVTLITFSMFYCNINQS